MSSRRNEQRHNGTGVPGIRLRTRRNRYGRQALELDVSWYDAAGHRHFTSFSVGSAPLKATERAMRKRELEAGVHYDITPRAAWLRLRANRGGARP